MQLQSLQENLNYRFKNTDLLVQALTHRSFAHEKGAEDNEQLEFLGDSILGMVASDYLLKSFPNHTTGELSQLKAKLVKESTLAKYARRLTLGRFMRLGKGESKTGGRRRPSILAGGLEAIIGAIYLDGSLEMAAKFVRSLLK